MRIWFRHLGLWLTRLWQWVQRSFLLKVVHLRRKYYCANKPARRVRAQPKPTWVRNEIIRLKALMPVAGCRMITHCFNRRWTTRRHMTVGKTYVADTIRRQQYAIFCARRKLKHRVPRPVPRNLIWGMDLMVKTDRQGRQHPVVVILDHASRACLTMHVLRDKSTRTLLQLVHSAVRRYGYPTYLRTDNEAVFASPWFRWSLMALGIRHQRTDPGCPWQNGRVERVIGTMKRLLVRHSIDDVTSCDRALQHVRTVYNHLRPHQHLHGHTPAEVWAGVDVFVPTRTSRRWLRRWERQWEQSVVERHSPG